MTLVVVAAASMTASACGGDGGSAPPGPSETGPVDKAPPPAAEPAPEPPPPGEALVRKAERELARPELDVDVKDVRYAGSRSLIVVASSQSVRGAALAAVDANEICNALHNPKRTNLRVRRVKVVSAKRGGARFQC
jgi:hypothetical protein